MFSFESLYLPNSVSSGTLPKAAWRDTFVMSGEQVVWTGPGRGGRWNIFGCRIVATSGTKLLGFGLVIIFLDLVRDKAFILASSRGPRADGQRAFLRLCICHS